MSSYRIINIPKEKTDHYHGLIYARWLRSLRHGNDYFKLIDPDVYYDTYRRYIGRILDSPDTAVRIAALNEDEDVVLGFSVCQGSVLHYVCVDPTMRKQGIGASLIPKTIDTISHITKTAIHIRAKDSQSRYAKWKFNPFV